MRPTDDSFAKSAFLFAARWLAIAALLVLPLLLSAQRAGQPQAQNRPEPIAETPVDPSQPGQPPKPRVPENPLRHIKIQRVQLRPDPNFTGELPTYPGTSEDGRAKYVPGQVLVRFRSGLPQNWMSIAHGVVRARVVQEFSMLEGLQLVQLPSDLSVEEAVRTYQRMPEVLYAEPNYIQYASVDPNDPRYTDGTQWAMRNTGQNGGVNDADIDADLAWNTTTGNAGTGPTDSNAVHIVVIDSGIDYNHPDLAANMAQLESVCNDLIDNDGNGFVDDCRGIDTFNNDTDPFDDNEHGTHVSGTVGAVGNNGDTDPGPGLNGVVGVNWNVRLVGCKFLNSSGQGPTAAAISCLNYAADLKQNRGKNIVATNNSWGSASDSSQALIDAVIAQRNAGILFIAAAGNGGFDGIGDDNDTTPNSPSNIFQPNVIAVASTTRTDARSGFSNFGRRNVHLGAPGSAITSTTPGNTYSSFNGTSMATPHVAGVAGLLKAANASRDWRAIKNLILAGGDNISSMNGATVTGKRLNANGALNCSNQVVLERVRPIGNSIPGSVGTPITLAALHINCANPNGDVTVTVNPGGQNIILVDNGTNGDIAAGDGIYMGSFTPSVAETTTLTFPNSDVVTITFGGGGGGGYTFAPTAFNYRTLTGNAININIGIDTSVELSGLPFPIQFNNSNFNTVYFQSAGVINFDGHFVDFSNETLPDADRNTLVAPFWDDLSPTMNTNNNIFVDVLGTAPNREVVIEWRNVRHFDACSSGTGITFQVVAFENNSDILFNYQDTFWDSDCSSFNNGASATVGIQVDSNTANQFSFNQAMLNDSMALLWTLQQQSNPVPSLTSLNPNNKTAGSPAFTLTVNGADFVNSSVVRWNNSPRTTTFVNSTQVTASISAADVTAPGMADVTVVNPEPGGGTSNALSFSIVGAAPFISSIQPNSLPATGPDFTLTVNGTSFANNAVVRWNGADRMTTFINSTKLEALIPASDIAAPGSATVRVFNPAPGGGLSNSATFTVSLRNPLPTITGLTPAGVLTGSGALNLSVVGTNFVFNSVVRWNGADRATTFINSRLLQAAILAGDVSSPGTADVTVFSPGPGGGTSNTFSFPIQGTPNPLPTTSSLFPSSVTADSVRGSLVVQVNGMNLTPASVVQWNGANRHTTFVNVNRIDATIPDSDLLAAGTAQVRVFTPAPGGGTSNSQSFTINNAMPVLNSLTPSSAPPGSPELVLVVQGSNFVPGSVVRWNGASRPTTFIGSNQLRATIPASDLANVGSANVTVFTPGPGGGTSPPQMFNITP